MVVRGHSCVVAKIGGVPYRVRTIVAQRGGGYTCPICWQRDLAPEEPYAAALEGLHTDDVSGTPLGWLKKIPPLTEPEDVRQDDEITA